MHPRSCFSPGKATDPWPAFIHTLFPIAPLCPEDPTYEGDFISVDNKAGVLRVPEHTALHTFHFQGYEAKRRVASFGWDWHFERRQLSKGKPIPKEFDWLIERVANKLSILPSDFAELLITEYPVGSVINWHRNAPPFALIAGRSMAAGCTIKRLLLWRGLNPKNIIPCSESH